MSPATDELNDVGEEEQDGAGTADARIGLVVAGTYRITRHIGSGGSSHVFEAEHVRLGKSFAVKLLRPEINLDKKTGQRFRREAKAVARLHSEHVVSVIDCGELDDHTPYVVLELLQGEDLRSLLEREGSLPARRAVQIILEACWGLSVVHEAGLVHRDLKPENLFIARRSTGQDWCKVLDFGVAKMEASLSTAQGAIVGTVRYMAPEQLADSAAVGPATDVYALAAILYECLTGRALHEGSSVQEVMYNVMNREPTALEELAPGVPRALVQAVTSGVAKDVGARPASAAALAQLLVAGIAGDNAANTDATQSEDDIAPLGRKARSSKSTPTPRWPLVLGLVCVSGLLGAWLASPRGDSRAPSTVVSEQPRALAPPAPSPGLPAALEPSGVASSVSALPSAVAGPSANAPGPPRVRKNVSAVVAPPGARSARPATLGRFDEANPYGQ